jgi:hypothetical protein
LKLEDKKEGEEFDTAKASAAGHALSSPSFNDVVSPESKPEDVGMDHPLTATLETFDNFIYTFKVGKKTDDDNYHFRISAAANITKDRTAGQDEKPEDKEKLDKEFQEKVKKLEDKLKQEQGCEPWTYLVSKWTIEPLLKERKDLLAEKKAEPTDKKDELKFDSGVPELLPPLPGIPKTDEKKPEEKKADEKPAQEKKPEEKKPEVN